MRYSSVAHSVIAGLLWAGGVAHAADPQEGFLCCNLQVDEGWISDINLHSETGTVLPMGTPVKVLGHGRQRVKLSVAGKELALGNDYSRKLDLTSFQQRYVLPYNPVERLQSAPLRCRPWWPSVRLHLA